MQKFKVKNSILFSIIFLSQAHVVFRGSGISYIWDVNGIKKTLCMSVFLFCVYFRFLIFSYCMMRPKGVSKDIPLFFFVVSFMDLLHFICLSSYGYEVEKILTSLIIFLAYKYYKS